MRRKTNVERWNENRSKGWSIRRFSFVLRSERVAYGMFSELKDGEGRGKHSCRENNEERSSMRDPLWGLNPCGVVCGVI